MGAVESLISANRVPLAVTWEHPRQRLLVGNVDRATHRGAMNGNDRQADIFITHPTGQLGGEAVADSVVQCAEPAHR